MKDVASIRVDDEAGGFVRGIPATVCENCDLGELNSSSAANYSGSDSIS